MYRLPTLRLRTDKTLSSLNISEDDIFAIIENLNSNKSHGWDDLSIKMINTAQKMKFFIKDFFSTWKTSFFVE